MVVGASSWVGGRGGETISGSEKPLITVVEGQSVLMCFFLLDWGSAQNTSHVFNSSSYRVLL